MGADERRGAGELNPRPVHIAGWGEHGARPRAGIYWGGGPAEGPPLLHELGGHRAHPEPQEVLDLAREDDQGDAAREPDGDRVRDELDGAAEPGEAEAREDDAREQGGRGEAVHAVALHDGVHDDHERARGAADLHARAAERGDQETGHDGGEEAALGADAARDREGDRERQRHDADDHARDDVREELVAGVSLERGNEFGDERVQVPSRWWAGGNLTNASSEPARPGGPARTPPARPAPARRPR